ncbi:hypothetical protein CS053_13255 [Rhodanobacter glycinis]|uniref:Uncharacterized protein n=1 Tax=Rhodanobacter glycinis TaxID=582702 RepID=A0A5B9E301_9GAMM|nr:hypothetical protein [Rhodanobacter glycinis]QEE25355.1 hypothetical protein CS053_13255 [Rhodanobacter glycinis]
MSGIFLVSLALIALSILWVPTYSMVLMLKGMGVPEAGAGLRLILPLQLLAAIALVLLANALGLGNPAAYTLAILVLVSATGVVIVWRRRHNGA